MSGLGHLVGGMPIPACGSRAGPQVFAHRHLPITGDHGVAAYPFTTAPAHNASAFYTARQGDRPASGVLRGQHPRYYAPVVRTGVFSTRETDSLPTRDHRAFIWPNQPPPLLRTGPCSARAFIWPRRVKTYWDPTGQQFRGMHRGDVPLHHAFPWGRRRAPTPATEVTAQSPGSDSRW